MHRAPFAAERTYAGVVSKRDATGAARINYEILGNSERALHVHIIPRYDSEPENLRRGPVWFYNWDASPDFDAQCDRPLMDKIADIIVRISN